MNLTVSRHTAFILKTLHEAGHEAYIVGGAVRDLLLAAQTNQLASSTTDYDFTTSARPEEIQTLFPEHFYENTFGTVSVTHDHLSQQMGLEVNPTATTEKPVDRKSQRLIDAAAATKLHISLQSNEDGGSASDTTKKSKLFPEYQITTFRSDEVYDDF